MKTFLSSRLVQVLGNGLIAGVSAIQHLCMKVAVAASLKLCLFTARVLMGGSNRDLPSEGLSQRAGQAF